MNGLMHAPITALPVEALIANDVDRENQVMLPPPFEKYAIDLDTFAPIRKFSPMKKETLVL
jgi:hypothetical protein